MWSSVLIVNTSFSVKGDAKMKSIILFSKFIFQISIKSQTKNAFQKQLKTLKIKTIKYSKILLKKNQNNFKKPKYNM